MYGDSSDPPPPPPPPSAPPVSRGRPTLLQQARQRFEDNPRMLAVLDRFENEQELRDVLNARSKPVYDLLEESRKQRLTSYAWRSRAARASEEKKLGGADRRIAGLLAALNELPHMEAPQESPTLRFRADGRSPWIIASAGGFFHYDRGDIDLVRAGLRSFALQHRNLSGWISQYRLTKSGQGVPTVSTGPHPEDASGASGARWQYAIVLDGLVSYELTAELLGVDTYKTVTEQVAIQAEDKILMNAPLLEQATEVAISGGPLGEVTFLTPIRLNRIVAHILLTDAPEYLRGVWRPFSHQELEDYRETLIRFGEFDFDM